MYIYAHTDTQIYEAIIKKTVLQFKIERGEENMGDVEEKTEKCERDIILFYLKVYF